MKNNMIQGNKRFSVKTCQECNKAVRRLWKRKEKMLCHECYLKNCTKVKSRFRE